MRDDGAGQHPQPGGVAHRPRHGDQPAPETGAQLVAGVPVHEDLAAPHPAALARARAPEEPAGGAPHHQPPAQHGRAREVPHPTLDDQLAPAHVRPGVHPRIARDREPAAGHPGTEELDEPQVTLDPHVLVAVARDGEEIGQLRPTLAVPDTERLDLAPAERGEPVGGEALGLERHGRRLAQRQRERHP